MAKRGPGAVEDTVSTADFETILAKRISEVRNEMVGQISGIESTFTNFTTKLVRDVDAQNQVRFNRIEAEIEQDKKETEKRCEENREIVARVVEIERHRATLVSGTPETVLDQTNFGSPPGLHKPPFRNR